MLRTFAFAAVAGILVGVPVVLVVNLVNPAAWVIQTLYFVAIGAAGLVTAHYDHQRRRGVGPATAGLNPADRRRSTPR